MKTFKLTLGGKEYEVHQLSRGQSKSIRYRLALAVERMSKCELMTLQNEDGSVPMDKIPLAEIVHMMDEIYDLLFEYSPLLKADAERIEEEATSDEIMEAFLILQKVLFGHFLSKTPKDA